MAVTDESALSLGIKDHIRNILVVEDDVSSRFALAEWLRLSGHTVYEAATADEAAILLASSISIHVVITDVDMPGTLNGMDLIENICATDPRIHLIVVSGQVREIANSKVLFLEKPYDLHELSSLVANYKD